MLTKSMFATVVLTGFRDKELENQIIKLGGVVRTAVSGKTTMVIFKQDKEKAKAKASATMIKAKQLNIPIIALEDVIAFM